MCFRHALVMNLGGQSFNFRLERYRLSGWRGGLLLVLGAAILVGVVALVLFLGAIVAVAGVALSIGAALYFSARRWLAGKGLLPRAQQRAQSRVEWRSASAQQTPEGVRNIEVEVLPEQKR